MKHARLSASSSERWMNCAGSVRLSEGIRRQETEFTIEGTAAHMVAARCLNAGADAEALVGLILKVRVESGDGVDLVPVEVTEEMAESVQVYLDYVRRQWPFDADAEGFVEVEISLADAKPPEPMYGTTDFAGWDAGEKHLEIVDFKHGAGVAVDATENSQLTYYALGTVLALRVKPKTITTTIVQPRGRHPDGIIRSHTFGWEELKEFKEELFERARATQDPNAPLHAGEWCRFCPAMPVCPELQKQTTAVVQRDLTDIYPGERSGLPAPEALSPEQVKEVLDKSSMIKGWLRAVEDYVHGILSAGGEFPGYKLVEKRSYRRWKDEDAVVEWAHQTIEPGYDLYTHKLRSPAQMEKLLKEAGVEGTLPEELVDKSSSGYNVVPDDHPKPAAKLSAGEAFEFDTNEEESK